MLDDIITDILYRVVVMPYRSQYNPLYSEAPLARALIAQYELMITEQQDRQAQYSVLSKTRAAHTDQP